MKPRAELAVKPRAELKIAPTFEGYLPSRHWLMKSEPDVFSFRDLMARGPAGESWDGVRNYTARNFMRDSMEVGDWVLFYHSSTEPPGIAGLARVVGAPAGDWSALDPKSEFFDPKATAADPRWVCVTVAAHAPFERYVSLETLRTAPQLAGMLVLRPGQRLSIQPVLPSEFDAVCRLGNPSEQGREAGKPPILEKP